MLVDAASMYFRAFHGVPTSVTAPAGHPVNAVRGYLDMTASLLRSRRPTGYVACLDLDWRPDFRVQLLPSYKQHRLSPAGGETVPDLLEPQVPILLATLQAIGLAVAGADGFEADDVIATLAAQATEPVEVVTGDRDLLALATDRVTVLYTGRGIARLEQLGPADIKHKYGVEPARYADLAVLRGDPSDGLPGVPGIGAKTAAVLVQRFGPVEAVVAAARTSDVGFPPRSAAAVRAAADYLVKAAAVVRGRVDAPVRPIGRERLDPTLPSSPAEPEALIELVDRHGLASSVNRLLASLLPA